MRSFVLLLLLIGIIFFTIGYTELKLKCPPPRIQYRILPQSYINEQLSGQTNPDVLNSLFNANDPFFRNDEINNKENDVINKNTFYQTFE